MEISAERRRRTMFRRTAFIAGALVALGAGVGAIAASTDEGAGGAPVPTRMPELDYPAAAGCVQHYPDGLADLPIAFDGTVLNRQPRALPEGAEAERNAAPVEVVLKVNEVYRGDLGSTVRMRTWNFDTSVAPQDHTGRRYLIASGEGLDAMFCGFTRPYNEQDAEYWEHVFQPEG